MVPFHLWLTGIKCIGVIEVPVPWPDWPKPQPPDLALWVQFHFSLLSSNITGPQTAEH